MNNFFEVFGKTKDRFDYLSHYTEFRYQQIVGSLYKLVHHFYTQHDFASIKECQSAIAKLTKTDHMKTVFLKPHNYAVSQAVVAPNTYGLDSHQLTGSSYDDAQQFAQCVEPILNA